MSSLRGHANLSNLRMSCRDNYFLINSFLINFVSPTFAFAQQSVSVLRIRLGSPWFPSRNSLAFCEQSLREPRNRSHFDVPPDDKLYLTFTPAGPQGAYQTSKLSASLLVRRGSPNAHPLREHQAHTFRTMRMMKSGRSNRVRSTGMSRSAIRFVVPVLHPLSVLMAASIISIELLSTIRAWVGGEGLYSKGQKNATYYLAQYSVSHW